MQPTTVRTCMRVAMSAFAWIDRPPWDDLDNLGHLGHFSVGQVGFIHKINFLEVIGYYAYVLYKAVLAFVVNA